MHVSCKHLHHEGSLGGHCASLDCILHQRLEVHPDRRLLPCNVDDALEEESHEFDLLDLSRFVVVQGAEQLVQVVFQSL